MTRLALPIVFLVQYILNIYYTTLMSDEKTDVLVEATSTIVAGDEDNRKASSNGIWSRFFFSFMEMKEVDIQVPQM